MAAVPGCAVEARRTAAFGGCFRTIWAARHLAFDKSAAQFPKLISGGFTRVWIDDVLHQATVAIDEKGTEASAATAVVFSGDSAAPVDPPKPKDLKIDRPFLFMIRDNPTRAVLFVGQVVDP
jgi:serpin B